MVKGGSKLLGKGGGGSKKNRDDCACHSTIHGALDATPLALPRGGLEGGVTPSTIRKKLK